MKNPYLTSGIIPINTTDATYYPTGINLEYIDLLEFCGDLLAIGKIKSTEWFKLKNLIKSNSEENINLAREILNAKATDDE